MCHSTVRSARECQESEDLAQAFRLAKDEMSAPIQVTHSVAILARWMAADLYLREVDALRFELSQNHASDEVHLSAAGHLCTLYCCMVYLILSNGICATRTLLTLTSSWKQCSRVQLHHVPWRHCNSALPPRLRPELCRCGGWPGRSPKRSMHRATAMQHRHPGRSARIPHTQHSTAWTLRSGD